MSSLERTLERGIDALSDDAYQRVRSGQADAFVWIERLDAALEYWLMKHSIKLEGYHDHQVPMGEGA